jgi:toxin ParE1/3/4
MAGGVVERSAEARRDMFRLVMWIGRQSGVGRAEAARDRIDAILSRLAYRPQLGRVRIDFADEPRSFSIPPWLVVYEPLAGDRGILVLRILDSRRDIAALMGQKS